VKLYVTASVPARARRRFAEMRKRGAPVTLDAIEADLAERDARDANRAAAPLRAAPDALTLDNSELNPEQSIAAAMALVERALRP
jgi:cytidylate kinase